MFRYDIKSASVQHIAMVNFPMDPSERIKHFIKHLSIRLCVRLHPEAYIFMECSKVSGDDNDLDVRTRGANYYPESPIIYTSRKFQTCYVRCNKLGDGCRKIVLLFLL